MRIDLDGPYYIIAAILLVITLLIMRKKFKHSGIYLSFFGLFIVYLLMVAKYTLFPITFGIPEFIDRELVLNSVNLIPFNQLMIENVILNVILTLPFGFLLPLVKKVKKNQVVLLWSILLPLIIETTQLLIGLATGILERRVDVTDVICNFIGVLVGFSIYRIFTSILKNFVSDNNEDKFEQFLNYIIQRKLLEK
jgi:glycopeptide antibiotics resistance protein